MIFYMVEYYDESYSKYSQEYYKDILVAAQRMVDLQAIGARPEICTCHMQ